MWSRNQRQIAARLFLRRLASVGLLGLVIVAGVGVWGVYNKERDSRALREQAERERAELSERRDKLSADLQMLRSDRGLEEELRAQYALAEAGEQLIVIVDAAPPAASKATSTIADWFRRTFWPW